MRRSTRFAKGRISTDRIQEASHKSSSTSISSKVNKISSYNLKQPLLYSAKNIQYNKKWDLEQLEEDCKTLKSVITIQSDSIYKNLESSKFAGVKNFELLRLPSDIPLFNTVLNQLETLLDGVSDSKILQLPTSLAPFEVIVANNDISVYDVAKLHGIDISEIKDTILQSQTTEKLDAKAISKIVDRELLRVKDSSIMWPMKSKKKKTPPLNGNESDQLSWLL